jgi:ribosomal protein S18 acetylase RimI-like enzyme
MNYRKGNIHDLIELKNLAIKSWSQFEAELTVENWQKLQATLLDENTIIDLQEKSDCVVCVSDSDSIIGMSFLVPSGNPTDIYDKDWSYIRFVTVDPAFAGQGIVKTLTEKCIAFAKQNGEKIIALHTSEMMLKARHIYEKLGFEILKPLEPRLGKKYWLYIKCLDAN